MVLPTIRQTVVSSFRELHGVVVSAGLMTRTVKVRLGNETFDKHIKKHWKTPYHVLVHDPAASVRTGDVVAISPGWRTSKRVRHVVTSIIAPFGTPLADRPAVPSEEERERERAEKRARKAERRAARRRAEGEGEGAAEEGESIGEGGATVGQRPRVDGESAHAEGDVMLAGGDAMRDATDRHTSAMEDDLDERRDPGHGNSHSSTDMR